MMNNDLEQFSEERLKAWVSDDPNKTYHVDGEDLQYLARIALSVKQEKSATFDRTNIFTDLDLEGMSHGNNPVANAYRELLAFRIAAKQAKPVAQVYQPANIGICAALGPAIRMINVGLPAGTLLYTTPHPAHTERVIRDGWKLVPEEATLAMLTLLGVTGSLSSMQQKYQNMLDAAPMHDACLTNEDAKSDGWVKCSEKLPGDDSFVLVTNGKHTGMGAYLRDDHLEDDERWQDEHFEFINKQSKYSVTHWMPLPPNPED